RLADAVTALLKPGAPRRTAPTAAPRRPLVKVLLLTVAAFAFLMCAGVSVLGVSFLAFPRGGGAGAKKDVAQDGGKNGKGPPVAFSDTKPFHEDFSSVKVGDQPDGWKCDPAITAFRAKEDGQHYL